MTENQIRQKVVDTAKAWLGVRAGSAEHANILKIYNAQDPLPRGTKMQTGWAWCAAFVSAVSLKLGYRDIMPTEMSCHQMVLLYKQLGRWIENDAYVPSPGDVILYDWDDGRNYAETDNTGTGANAAAHNSFIHQNANAEEGIVSWHYTVDDHEIYHHLPDDETAYHAGDGMEKNGGNMNGIGIEMCVNEGGNYEQTLINTEKLCAQLCLAYNLNPDKALKKHQDFMEKVCPAKLINEGRWDEFCAAVKQRHTELKTADAEN